MQRYRNNNNAPVRVAIDAMGGDFAPKEIVKGAVESIDAVEAILVHTLDTLGGRTAHVAGEAGESA